MFSSVTHKYGFVKSDFGLEFSNAVNRANINKRGCSSLPTIHLLLPRNTAENISLVLFISI